MLGNGRWHETASEMALQADDEFARGQEWALRAARRRWADVSMGATEGFAA